MATATEGVSTELTFTFYDNSTTEEIPVQREASTSFTDYAIYYVSAAIFKYGILVLGTIGTVGNTLALMVLNRRAFRATTTAIFLRVLAVFDILTLWSYMLWNLGVNFVPAMNSLWFCKVTFWVMASVPHIASYTLLTVALERFIAVTKPLHVRKIFTPVRARIISACTILVIFSYNSVYMLTTNMKEPSKECNYYKSWRPFMDKWYYFDAAIGIVSPALLIFILNMVTIAAFKKSQNLQGQMTNMAATQKPPNMKSKANDKIGNSKDELPISASQVKLQGLKSSKPIQAETKNKGQSNYLTVMLIVISLAYWTLNMPSGCFFIAQIYWKYWETHDDYALFFLLYHIVYLLMLTNNSLNFFMYVLTGRKFRKELKAIFIHKPTPRYQANSSISTICTELSTSGN